MTVRDRSKVTGLFSASFSEEFLDTTMKNSSFKQKLKEGDFDEFTWKDWKQYFIMKAKENGVSSFIPGNPAKESGIIKSLMKNFSTYQIKEMIDFVWECDEHSLVTHKSTMGIWIFSSGYLQSVTQLLAIWKEKGTLKNQNKPLIESKWDDSEDIMKPRKKSRVIFGEE